jgi:micrococcal nuclease
MREIYMSKKYKNSEKFDIYAGLVLGKLYENFPKSQGICSFDFILEGDYNEDTKYDEALIVSETIWWLGNEEFISFSKPHERPIDNVTSLFSCVTLTSKGLKALKRPVKIEAVFDKTGKVVRVTDGDTITILTDKKEQIKIRLDGIDAPETKQAYGDASRKNLADICAGESATVKDKGQDRYKRTLGVVYCKNTNANEKQVKDGLAWAYVKYGRQYVELEKEARNSKAGLWADNNPTPPWEWRKNASKIQKKIEK